MLVSGLSFIVPAVMLTVVSLLSCLYLLSRYLVSYVVGVELVLPTFYGSRACDVVGVEPEMLTIHGSCTCNVVDLKLEILTTPEFCICDIVGVELDILTIHGSCTRVVPISSVYALMCCSKGKTHCAELT